MKWSMGKIAENKPLVNKQNFKSVKKWVIEKMWFWKSYKFLNYNTVFKKQLYKLKLRRCTMNINYDLFYLAIYVAGV